mgnify:CR=1 FL=1
MAKIEIVSNSYTIAEICQPDLAQHTISGQASCAAKSKKAGISLRHPRDLERLQSS